MKIFSCLGNREYEDKLRDLAFVVYLPTGNIDQDITNLRLSDVFVTNKINNHFWIYYATPTNEKRYIYYIGSSDKKESGVEYFNNFTDLYAQLVDKSPLNIRDQAKEIESVKDENNALKLLVRNLLLHIYDKSEDNVVSIDKHRMESLSNRIGISVKTDDNRIELQFTSKSIGRQCY